MDRLFNLKHDRVDIIHNDKNVGFTIVGLNNIPCMIDDNSIRAILNGAKLRLEILEEVDEKVRWYRSC